MASTLTCLAGVPSKDACSSVSVTGLSCSISGSGSGLGVFGFVVVPELTDRGEGEVVGSVGEVHSAFSATMATVRCY